MKRKMLNEAFDKLNKQLINEIFDIRIGDLRTASGEKKKIVYIQPTNGDNLYQYKDKVKNDFKGNWLRFKKVWGWFVDNNTEYTIKKYVKPCIEFLVTVESNPNNNERDPIKIINQLLKDLNVSENVDDSNAKMSTDEIKDRLLRFKQDLINCTTSEEFKQKFGPLIKFRNATSRNLSWHNTILIYMQNPRTRMVKSYKQWQDVNRQVRKGAKGLLICIPLKFIPFSKEEKKMVKDTFLRTRGVKNAKELKISDQEELKVRLKGIPDSNQVFAYKPVMFAYEDTFQIEGKEDIVGNPDTSGIEWYDGRKEETKESRELTEALFEVIKKCGVSVNFVKDLGGARGVSKSGTIDVLEGEPFSIGFFDTLTHEFSHELLHQTYIKSKNDDLKQYFVGTAQGRAKVEQQAELSAWIVVRNYGYDMPTDINYVGIWGLDEKNAVSVFDSVANVASRIVREIDDVLAIRKHEKDNNMNESIMRKLSESFLPDGEELADMLGLGDVYKKSEEMNNGNYEDNYQNNDEYLETDDTELDNSELEDSDNITMESIKNNFFKKFNLLENTIKNNFIR